MSRPAGNQQGSGTAAATRQLRSVDSLIDRVEIVALVDLFCHLLDEALVDELDAIFYSDAHIELVSGGQRSSFDSLADFIEFCRSATAAWATRQHVATNVMVDLHGDDADVGANMVSFSTYLAAEPDSHYDSGALLRLDAQRRSDRWRFSRMTLTYLWNSGGPAPIGSRS